MTHRPLQSILIVACLALLAAAGCLERNETITVKRDGSAEITLAYTGSPEDFRTADALPSAATGWKVKWETRKNGDDEERILRTRRKFAAGSELPGSYAADDDADADLSLAFPTTLHIEERPDGTYYHFRRNYTPRAWSNVRFWNDHFIDDDIEKLAERPSEDLTLEERVKIMRAFTNIEAYEQVEHARAALAEIDPGLSQDRWLAVRRAVLDVYDSIDLAAFVSQFETLSEEERNAAIDAEGERYEGLARSAMVQALQRFAKYDDGAAETFAAAYERADRRHKITNQVGGHKFIIRVRMPGEIVAHNARKVDQDGAFWEFHGSAFRDRAYPLMITSRVTHESDGK
ncbi:MAG: hypothetical protein O7B26_11285 [Planctomycetota bacterium]|nr:hypothetical protein [Planctomycetota bacterium]